MICNLQHSPCSTQQLCLTVYAHACPFTAALHCCKRCGSFVLETTVNVHTHWFALMHIACAVVIHTIVSVETCTAHTANTMHARCCTVYRLSFSNACIGVLGLQQLPAHDNGDGTYTITMGTLLSAGPHQLSIMLADRAIVNGRSVHMHYCCYTVAHAIYISLGCILV
jgi:hypothetical protein